MDDDSRSRAILIVTAVFLAISGISVALRCFVRAHVVRAFGWDDTFMVLAMIFNLAFAICGIAGSKYGIGRRLVHFVEYPDNFHKAMLVCFTSIGLHLKIAHLTSIPVLVARPNSLRDHLRHRETLHYYHTATNHRRPRPRLGALRCHDTRHHRRPRLSFLHHLPVPTRQSFLEPRESAKEGQMCRQKRAD